MFCTAQMKLGKLQRLHISYTEGKILSVIHMLSRSFTQKDLQLNQTKHKRLLPQIHFAKVTHDKQI